ncbi:MAG: preprotein translocase subunit SecG [Bdellovibrionales bacterium]|nr:preprotein translocase subunit SecG [Bdellovibrionales bacterium]
MQTLLTFIHITACVLLIPVILLQSGKGADISASFGGSSQTVFGSSGGANFFTRLTTILAAIFMLTSLTITTVTNRSKKSVFEGTIPVPASAPAAAPSATSPTTAASPEAAPTTGAAAPSEKK